MIAAIRPAVASLSRSVMRAAPVYRAAFSTSLRALELQKRFTAEHEWITFDPATKIGTVGITDHAQNSLGDVVFVSLASEGAEVSAGDDIGSVESVKAASDIYSPVDGVVESVNNQLKDEPGLINKEPEAGGWLCKIKLSDASQIDGLLSAEEYKQVCEN